MLYNSPYIYAGTVGGSIFRREKSTQENGNPWIQMNPRGEIEVKGGSGKISSTGTTVKGNEETQFTTELTIGDMITAGGQNRIVTQIDSENFLEVNTPFEPSLNNNSFSITTPNPNTDITAFAIYGTTIFAATAGNGIFASSDNGQKWNPVNIGITNLNITAIVVSTDGEIFAGTKGGGVFRSQNLGRVWTDVNIGLTNLEITALTVDVTGFVFAGTSRGGVFRFDSDSNTWSAVNQGLTNPDITTLASYGKLGDGTINSESQTVKGDNSTNFTQDFLGRSITAAGESRTVTAVISPREITIDQPFCPNLPPGTTFTSHNFLVAGTVGGDIFSSQNQGENWKPALADFSDTDITDIIIHPDNGNIFVGTTVGNILYSSDSTTTWRSLNRGLVNLQEKLLILSRIQPRFTDSQYGDPGYAQLSNNCAVEICTGAEDGSEMGVFSYLKQPQRQGNLEASLKEYLRFGLEVSIFYMT